ncbi:MAG TPA: caspase family protein [Acidimicrobiales bacterium]|nr:caspase family protein [Acidimicrobiales bacterium]
MKGRIRLLVLALAGVLLTTSGAPAEAAPPTKTDKRRALVMGIGKHAGRTKGTVGGVGDAEAFHTALRAAGFQPDHIMVLTDKAATAAGIRKGLEWLEANSDDDTFSVFHFSGHVLQRGRDLDRDGEVLDEYLMTYNSRQLISDRELSDRLKRVRGKLWADIAGCEAAGFDEGGLSSPNRLVTASSQENQKSYEWPDWRRSVFTGLLVYEGMLQRRADSNRDGMVSIHEAFRHAADLAPQMTARQRMGPQNPYLAGGGGGDWFLQRPAPSAPAAQPKPAPLCILFCRS